MDLPAFLAAAPGFLLGMIVIGPMLRWGASIWVVTKEQRRDPAHRSRWRIVAAVLLHSGPWFGVGAGVFAYFILSRPHGDAWYWFFGGALLSPLVFGLYIWRFLRLRRARSKIDQR
jgi:hypothetical protein